MLGASAALIAGCANRESPGSINPAVSLTAARAASPAYRVLHRFGRAPRLLDGYHPIGLLAMDGTLYGTTQNGGAYGGGTAFALKARGSLRIAHSFGATKKDGSKPSASLTAVNGVLYGVTEDGGSCDAGTVFSLTTIGTEKVLHSFCGADGGSPQGSLVAVNGSLYGTASTLGGTPRNIGGTVFTITTSGGYHVLHRFHATRDDGFSPNGSLAVVKGVLYGTTAYGGTACSDFPGCGTIYSITTHGSEKVIYSFRGLSDDDGLQPEGGVTAVDGALYGTTFFGGANDCHEGCGVVYRATTRGSETILYRFDAAANGQNPAAGVIGLNGTLYGTTTAGGGGSCGTDRGCGTVYGVTPSGKESVLHAFGGTPDGADSESNLVKMHGKLFGATISGGLGKKCRASLNAPDPGCGTIFTVTP